MLLLTASRRLAPPVFSAAHPLCRSHSSTSASSVPRPPRRAKPASSASPAVSPPESSPEPSEWARLSQLRRESRDQATDWGSDLPRWAIKAVLAKEKRKATPKMATPKMAASNLPVSNPNASPGERDKAPGDAAYRQAMPFDKGRPEAAPRRREAERDEPGQEGHRPKRRRHPKQPPRHQVDLSEIEQPYAVALETDKPHRDAISSLRRQYFPPERLKVDAHLTIFHALPGDRLQDIRNVLTRVAGTIRREGPGSMRKLRNLMHGKAAKQQARPLGKKAVEAQARADGRFNLHIRPRGDSVSGSSTALMLQLSKPDTLQQIRRQMQHALQHLGVPLTSQDLNEHWGPHYTIGNYFQSPEAREAAARDAEVALRTPGLSSVRHGKAHGLVLWRYVNKGCDKGQWVDPERFLFYTPGEGEDGEESPPLAKEDVRPVSDPGLDDGAR
ncbi:uncharacterized protein B0I36DRAFT_146864 [Microdochium trichocladiopsis]|uniref:RNA ligase/cyclic nucleotide phosphodiesterase n=1 Tax=Microdochium trichocladiopsis TaxID=1682393 RepID=A0A9P8Y5L9_9PEZI|nr:uncharacterized protein B0I36DRAFT_146864 [Microdochium trichocladiopsis]KAH7028070.1 hypothetical protein B0I36DRAFT_146864 [Microdochium trichocladiopsis]